MVMEFQNKIFVNLIVPSQTEVWEGEGLFSSKTTSYNVASC